MMPSSLLATSFYLSCGACEPAEYDIAVPWFEAPQADTGARNRRNRTRLPSLPDPLRPRHRQQGGR
jgi:hypothetical protein